MKKDSNVELLRIVACLLVIGVHVKAGDFLRGHSRTQSILALSG